jgi:hypothetical protein
MKMKGLHKNGLLNGGKLRGVAAAAILTLMTHSAQAAPTYLTGRINDVTFSWDWVMIRLDAGIPDNCAGTPSGWMKVQPEYKAMTAFVIGLWMRGDAAQTVVTVYTDGLVGGYCRITQIDPAN